MEKGWKFGWWAGQSRGRKGLNNEHTKLTRVLEGDRLQDIRIRGPRTFPGIVRWAPGPPTGSAPSRRESAPRRKLRAIPCACPHTEIGKLQDEEYGQYRLLLLTGASIFRSMLMPFRMACCWWCDMSPIWKVFARWLRWRSEAMPPICQWFKHKPIYTLRDIATSSRADDGWQMN